MENYYYYYYYFYGELLKSLDSQCSLNPCKYVTVPCIRPIAAKLVIKKINQIYI